MLKEKIQNKEAKVGVIGLGYVGLPLIMEFVHAGFPCTGFDVDQKKIDCLKKNESYIKHIGNSRVQKMNDSGRFQATADFSKLREMDCILVAVPTPLDKHQQPDMSYIVSQDWKY